jgi:hypothetical protein
MCDMTERKNYRRIKVSSGQESIARAFDFLMDILKRPKRALYVQHIECHKATTWHMDYKEVQPMRDLSNEEMNLIQTAVGKGGFIGLEADRVVKMLMQTMDNALSVFGSYR